MLRYRIEMKVTGKMVIPTMVERVDGEWVRYSDVAGDLARAMPRCAVCGHSICIPDVPSAFEAAHKRWVCGEKCYRSFTV